MGQHSDILFSRLFIYVITYFSIRIKYGLFLYISLFATLLTVLYMIIFTHSKDLLCSQTIQYFHVAVRSQVSIYTVDHTLRCFVSICLCIHPTNKLAYILFFFLIHG